MSGFDRAQAAYDAAEPGAYTAAQEDEIERLENDLLSRVARDAAEIVDDAADDMDESELLDVARENAIARLKGLS